MSRNRRNAPTIAGMRNQRGLSPIEALGIAAVLVLAAVVLYPLVRSAINTGPGPTTGATVAIEGAAAEAPGDRLPMLAYIESIAEGHFFLFRRFAWSVMSRSYLEDVGVYERADAQGTYKDPFEGVYLWAMTPNTGIEFLNPQGDPYRAPQSAEDALALFGNGTGGRFLPEAGAGFGTGFAGGAQTFGFEQPAQAFPFGESAFSSQPGLNQPGVSEPGLAGRNPLGQPGSLGSAQPGYPLGGQGLDF
jgi:hypothetical protein